ncbi:MAG: DUF308 domain-containing protein [Clostridiales bacterium]|nr:DUF308 domain-containing protein [Clostridiales bacterium]
MKELIKSMKLGALISAIVSIALGIVMIVFPEISGKVICYIFGAILLLIGIVRIVRHVENREAYLLSRSDLITGLIFFGLGLFTLLKVDSVIAFLFYIFGFFIMVTGIISIQNSLDLKRLGHMRWIVLFIMSVLDTALGLVVLLNPFKAAAATMIFVAISLLYYGVVCLWTLFCLIRLPRNAKVTEVEYEMIEDSDNGDDSVNPE